jgi:hypothetical protein
VTIPGSFVAGKYRLNQPYLLQSVPSRDIAPRIAGGYAYFWDRFGPSNKVVDLQTGWTWSRAGGDWIDANGVRYGTAAFCSILTDGAYGATAVKTYNGNITTLARYVQTGNRWFAVMLMCPNAGRVIAGKFHALHSAPFVDVTYTNGQSARLAARVVAVNDASSSYPNTTAAEIALPCFVEFERPTAPVASAQLTLTVTQHWSGSSPQLQVFLLDPPITNDAIQLGLANTAGLLDAGIESHSAVIGAHRYLDGKLLSDFTYGGRASINAEIAFDPAIWGNGATDTSKFPHAGLGKWINTDENWSLVNSSYRGEGFTPLAPGLGAIRLTMAATPGVADGSIVGNYGGLAADGMIFLPEALFGRLGRIFVRYYVRLGGPYEATVANRKHVYHSPGISEWTTYAGKFGITPHHETSYGGVSGSSGGGGGWQMRLSWYDCDAGQRGPDEGGVAVGYHLYDFLYQNPPGHNYGKGDGGILEGWGMKGGVGGMLYAGHWYCVETEIKLNTVFANAPGYQADGELRSWVDGRMAYERTGMVFRTLPFVNQPYSPMLTRPCRELGVKGIWLNWFHGGKTVNTFNRTSFYSGLVWSKEYIGPMKM